MKETKYWKLKKNFVKSLWSKEKIKNLFVNLGNEIPKTINYKLQAVKKKQSGHDEFIIVNWHRGNWGYVELK